MNAKYTQDNPGFSAQSPTLWLWLSIAAAFLAIAGNIIALSVKSNTHPDQCHPFSLIAGIVLVIIGLILGWKTGRPGRPGHPGREIEAIQSNQTKKEKSPKLRFLIVDDTTRARQSMKALLEVLHPSEEVREAVNGTEAIQLAEEFQPEFILMDARMRGISGLEATRQIKAKWPKIRIIILSVFADYQALAEEAGADAFISKSEHPDNLRATLRNILQEKD